MALLTFSTTSDTAFVQGAWSSEEEGQLLHVFEELVKGGKTDMSARGFWVFVSKALGGTRTPKQCQNKWCIQFVLGSSSLHNAALQVRNTQRQNWQ
jgi:hypothetical protein